MPRVPPFALVLILAWAAVAGARAQPAPPADAAVPTAPPPPPPPPAAAEPSVEVIALAAPDAFSTAGRDTGLPSTLWRQTSLQVVKAVLPLLAERPLAPAAAALARRVLATGAQGPEGADQDPVLVAGRAQALMTQGDPAAAAAILARAPGLDRNAELARVAAESALLAGDDARACRIEQALTAGREEIYWVRLRTYCQALAGRTAEAQLSFELAQSQARDAVFTRLMGAKLAGAGNPGAPSLRNGLDYALSRSLGLDLAQAKPAPAVAAALAKGEPAGPNWDLGVLAPEIFAVARPIAAGAPLQAAQLEALLDAADAKDPKLRVRAQAAALIVVGFAEPLGPTLRARIAALPVAEGRAPAGRDLALERAAAASRPGETALLALWTCAEAPAGGLSVADRARIVWSLRRAGLSADARGFALEGLLGLK